MTTKQRVPLRRRGGGARALVLAAGGALFFSALSGDAWASDVCLAPKSPADLAKVWYSPCPEPTEGPKSLKLPLPVAGATMAFRPVITPGRQIFSRCVAEGRSHVFGDPQDPFAPESRRAVTGAFRTEDGWKSYLATYEMSVGQAASILAGDPNTGAEGDFPKGLMALAELMAGAPKTEAKERPEDVEEIRKLSTAMAAAEGAPPPVAVLRALARPASGLSAADFDRLAERYSAWCYRNGPCAETLRRHASNDGEPGFLRLPSEVEWEYAARGGANNARFNANLVVDRGALKRYGVLGGFDRGAGVAGRAVIGVGRAPTTGGFYDFYGNVAELTIDYFSSEYGSGKYGGRAARGGSYLTPHDLIGSGFREEAPLHKFARDSGAYLGAYRSPSLGARLAIGAVVKSDEAFIREARDAAKSEECAAVGDDDPLAEGLRKLATEVVADVEDVALRQKIERNAEDTRRALTQRTQNLCRILARDSVELSRDIVFVWIRFYEKEGVLRDMFTVEDEGREYYGMMATRFRGQTKNLRFLAEEYFERYAGAMKSMSEHGRSCFIDGFEHARAELRQRGPSKREVTSKNGAYTVSDAIDIAARHAMEAWVDKSAPDRWAEEFNRVGAALTGEPPRLLAR